MIMDANAQHRARQSEELKIRLSAAMLSATRKVATARGETVSKLVRTAMIRTINESNVTPKLPPDHTGDGMHKVLRSIYGRRA